MICCYLLQSEGEMTSCLLCLGHSHSAVLPGTELGRRHRAYTPRTGPSEGPQERGRWSPGEPGISWRWWTSDHMRLRWWCCVSVCECRPGLAPPPHNRSDLNLQGWRSNKSHHSTLLFPLDTPNWILWSKHWAGELCGPDTLCRNYPWLCCHTEETVTSPG